MDLVVLYTKIGETFNVCKFLVEAVTSSVPDREKWYLVIESPVNVRDGSANIGKKKLKMLRPWFQISKVYP